MPDRRQFDREILDEIKEVRKIVTDIQIDAAVTKSKVEQHMEDSGKLDAHARICSLEQSRKLWRAIVVAVPSFGGLIFGIVKLIG